MAAKRKKWKVTYRGTDLADEFTPGATDADMANAARVAEGN